MSPSIHVQAARLRFRLRRFAGCASHEARLSRPLRVAQLSDLHVGRVTPIPVLETAMALCNAHHPDLVCLTGDYVAHSQAYLGELTRLVASLEAPTVAVLGNHDHWADGATVRLALEAGGVRVLSNERMVFERGGDRLQLVGLDDAYTGHADPAKALAGLEVGLATLGLAHIPESAESLWAGGVPLVLSGHTHGGQVTVARLHEFWLGRIVGHRYLHGLYGSRQGQEAAVYVSAGIGASVVPLRLGWAGQRELTLFELGSPAGSFPEPLAAADPFPGRTPSRRTLAARLRKIERRQKKKTQK